MQLTSSLPEIVQLADAMMVLPMLRDGLRRHGLESQLTPELHEALQAVTLLNRLRNRDLVAQARDLAALLAEIDVRPVFLKGMAQILDDPYSDAGRDSGARLTSDLDVLVPPDRLGAVVTLMQDRGYATGPGEPRFDVAQIRPISHHAPPLRREGQLAWTEIHRGFFADPDFLLPAAEIIAQAQPVAQAGWTAFVPSPEHRALLAVSHGCLRNLERFGAGVSLRDATDLLALTERRGVDAAALLPRFRAHGVGRDYLWYGAMITQLFGHGAAGGAFDAPPWTGWAARAQARLALRIWSHARWRAALAWGKPLNLPLSLASNPVYRRHIRLMLWDREYRAAWRSTRANPH